MCSLRMLAPALVPPTVTPCGVAGADHLGHGRTAEQGRQAQLVAAGEEDAGRLLQPLQPCRAPGSHGAVSKSMTVDARSAELD